MKKQLYTYLVCKGKSNQMAVKNIIGWRKTYKQAIKFAEELFKFNKKEEEFQISIIKRQRCTDDFGY